MGLGVMVASVHVATYIGAWRLDVEGGEKATKKPKTGGNQKENGQQVV
jgi:hypothetical protein